MSAFFQPGNCNPSKFSDYVETIKFSYQNPARFITIGNDGQDIARTNYWETEPAFAGLCFVSINAGAIRLLVPKATEFYLMEMRTANQVTIERSQFDCKECIDVVFEDGTPNPFFVAVPKTQFHVFPRPSLNCPFSVWTEAGKQMQLFANVERLG